MNLNDLVDHLEHELADARFDWQPPKANLLEQASHIGTQTSKTITNYKPVNPTYGQMYVDSSTHKMYVCGLQQQWIELTVTI